LFNTISSMARPMPPLGDEQNFAVQKFCDARVRQIKYGADARVAGALDDDEFLFPRGAVEGILDAADEKVVVRVLDVFSREIRLDRDGTHRLDGNVELERFVDEHGVLVDALAVHVHEPLPDGLDEADAPAAFSQRGEKADGRGCFTVVLLRRCDEDTRGYDVHRGGYSCCSG
jgi:hypothetical protein